MSMIKRTFYGAGVTLARGLVSILDGFGLFRFPRVVRVETTDICNANCSTCTREIMTRSMGTMDMGLYKKIVDECSLHRVRYIHLHNFGEPLLDKLLFERISYARQKGIDTKLFSNFSLLDEEMARRVVASGLGVIKASIDGDSKETFEGIRKGIKFDNVVENIDTLLKVRKELNSKTPLVGLVFVETEKNYSEREGFVRRWKGKVDSIHISSYHNWGGSLNGRRNPEERGMPCLRVWQTFTVLWNGDVALCCMDYDGKVLIGNVNRETISDIFNGEKLRGIRESHLRGEFGKIPICLKCEARR
ncbi:MAG: SPASM domain-containing protein [Deltaproteobacteria bacterium]|nr:SPASM domain-containing protein [Deltaproteobacteria bacterium]